MNTLMKTWMNRESNPGPLKLLSGALPRLSYTQTNIEDPYSPNYYIHFSLNACMIFAFKEHPRLFPW